MKVETIDLQAVSIFCSQINNHGNTEFNHKFKAFCPELDVIFYADTERDAIAGLINKIKIVRVNRLTDFIVKLRSKQSV